MTIVDDPLMGAVTEVRVPDGTHRQRHPRELLWNYEVDIIERWQTGTDYTLISERLAKWYSKGLDAGGLAGTTLAVDYTGVGSPMYNILCKDMRLAGAKVRMVPISITAGSKTNQREDNGGWNVPKKDLVSVVRVLLGGGDKKRLRMAPDLDNGRTLMAELDNFKYKINKDTGNESYEAWRDRDHDDIVLALAVALWTAERATKVLNLW